MDISHGSANPFPMLRGYAKSGILCAILESIYLCQEGIVWTMNKGLQSLPWAPPIFLMHCMKIIKHLISNEWRFLQYRIQFDMLRGYPKPCIFRGAIWRSTLVGKTLSELERAHGCCQKLLSYSSCIWGGLLTTSVAMDVSRGSIAPHFPCWKGAKNLAFFFCTIWESFCWVILNRNDMAWTRRSLYVPSTATRKYLDYASEEDYRTVWQNVYL